ncbi:restriction endonuclease subunit S [Salinicola endophyticus]|uniref:Restriction endonuclease subunit S n=1 Tax=Salinicola endophyticus TaxID=1949083 RepID=A0AB74UAU9_9GAMM
MSTKELITDHLDLWTGAVTHKSGTGRGNNGKIELTGIKKLRELILELAVRGKLVEQDPSEEPASVLLDRIAEEKTRLVKEGKIKKPKNLKEVADEEKPFGLPEGWAWARMEAVSEYIQRGKGPKYAESGKVRVISQKCVQWSGLNLSTTRFVDDNSLNGYQDERYIRKNDILWNSTGTGTVGRAIVVKEPQHSTVVDSHVTIVRPLITEPCHILNYISSPSIQKRIEPDHKDSLVSGSTKQVELNSGSVKLLAVPLPPLSEQHRIVEKVDELMALCDRLEQQVGDQLEAHEVLVDTLLDALTRSTDAAESTENWARVAEHFDTLFTTEASIDKLKKTILQLAVMGRLVEQDPGDEPASVLLERIAEEKAQLVKEGKIKKTKKIPDVTEDDFLFELPKDWAWTRFENIVDPKFSISYGVLVPGPEPKNGVPLVRVADLSLSNPSDQPEKSISHEVDKKFAKTRLNGGEILLCVVGSIGKLGVAPNSWKGANIARAICRIMPTKLVSESYILMLLQTEFMQVRFGKDTRTLAQPTLNVGLIRSASTPLPPFEEQKRIVDKVDKLMALCDQLKVRLAKAGETRKHLIETVVEQAVG